MFVLDTTGGASNSEDSLATPNILFGNMGFCESGNSKDGANEDEVNMSMVLTFAGTVDTSSQARKKRLGYYIVIFGSIFCCFSAHVSCLFFSP